MFGISNYRKRFVVLVFVLSFAIAYPISAATIELYPESDRTAQDDDMDGTFDTLFPETDTILHVSLELSGARLPSFFYKGECRSALEFDISTIPIGSTILSAIFIIEKDGSGSCHEAGELSIFMHGYAGDGVVTIPDMSIDNMIKKDDAPF